MAEQLGELTRTHTCGALRPDDVGADVVLLGWVHRVRDLGGLLFMDVRDRDGITQVVFRPDSYFVRKMGGLTYVTWSFSGTNCVMVARAVPMHLLFQLACHTSEKLERA